ncbi:hypothetical protein ACSFBF_00680 [Variovorax sp. ZT5P49]|uniref:hypothetical protein n=1 Tax=Variovorax sp. ZT5P49 TaxID=3443733 RepID=UPI003F446BA9
MTRTWNWPPSVSPQHAVHAVGLVAVLIGVWFWADRLHSSRPAPSQAPAVAALPGDPAAQTVATWLGPGQLRLNVAVIGLMRRQDRAVAVLTINGASPKAFMAGEALMRDVTLVSIEPDGVTVDRAGTVTRIAAPPRPDHGPAGIVRVP